jgi:predicted dinucleotide-binding enzyme
MRQTIAILGAAGPMGAALARRLTRAGHRVLLAGRTPARLSALASDLADAIPGADIDILDCSREASWEADIIIPAIPYCAQQEVAARIRDVVTRKTVVSIVNPASPGAGGSSAAEELASLLPHAHVVKAFNTIPAPLMAAETVPGRPTGCYIAGDNADAVGAIAALAADAGFTPVIAGGLSASRGLEQKIIHHQSLTQ